MSTNQPGAIVGLTGGIATGKSTVSGFFSDLGVPVIDADDLARQIVAPGQPALDEITDAFGDEVLADDGSLNRPALADIVFDDEQARQQLNAITHPRIAQAMMDRARRAFEDGHLWVIYDAALLVETGTHKWLQALIVVDCQPQTQIKRLTARDDLSDAQARQRIDAQMPLAEKRQAADYIIDNDGSLEETQRQVEELKATIDHLLQTTGQARQGNRHD